MPYTSEQIGQLDAASAKIAAGKGTDTDVKNVNYAKTKGYAYTPPKAAPAPAPAKAKQATLYGDGGKKTVVDVGSKKAANLQKLGWGLTKGSYKKPKGSQATLYGKGGKKVVVDVGSKQASKLQSQGWGLKPGSYRDPNKPIVDSKEVRDQKKQEQRDQKIADAEEAQRKAEKSENFEMNWAKDIPGQPELPSDAYPLTPDLVALYKAEREAQGIQETEDLLNDKLAELDAFEDSYDEGRYDIGQELTPMQLVRGEQAELQEQYIRQKNSKTRVIDALQRNLDGKNATVDMMMKFTQQNFDNARNSYNDRFDNAMKFQQQWYSQFKDERDYARLVSNDEKDRDFQERQLENTIKQQEEDNARANVTILMNTMADSGKGWDDMSQAEKNNFTKLEQQAGLPANSLQSFGRSKPEAQLLGTTNGVDKDGNDIITFIYKDKDGNPGTMVTKKTGGFTDQSKSGGDGFDTGQDVLSMSVGEINADYENSLRGLGGVIEVTAGDGGTKTRDQAIQELFDYYQGRIKWDKIADDVYRTYQTDSGEYERHQTGE